MNAQELIGQVVANVAQSLIQRGNFGVRIHGVTEFDSAAMLGALTAKPLPRVAVAGCLAKKLSQATKFPLGLLTGDLAQATLWRNDPSSKSPVIVVSQGEEERLGSFHRFKEVDDNALYSAICDKAIKEICPNEVLERWWTVLRRRRVSRHISVNRLANYFLYIKGQPSKRPAAAREGLHLLGLLPSLTVFDQPTSETLFKNFNRNSALVYRIEILSNPDRDRLGKAVEGAQGRLKRDFQTTLGRVLKYNRTGTDNDRAKLSYESVAAVFEARTGGGGKAPTRVVTFERAGVEAMLRSDDEDVSDLAGKLREAITAFDEDEMSGEPIDLRSGAGRASVKIPSSLVRLLSRAVDPNVYGGIFSLAADGNFDSALADIDKAEFSGFTMAGEKSFEDRLRRVIDRGLMEPEVLQRWREFVEARSILSANEVAISIALSPLLTFAGDKALLDAGAKYLEAYAQLSDAIRSRYEAIASESPTGARGLCSQLMVLDIIFVQTANNVFGMLSPLHPLHMWKYVRLAKQFYDDRGTLTDDQKTLMAESAERLPHFLTALFVPSGLLGREQALVLPESHQIATLPCYQLENPHYAGVEGQEKVIRILGKYLALYPHARKSLRLALVDPPDVAGFLEQLALEISGEDLPLQGMQVSVWRTIDRSISVTGDDQQLEAISSVFGAEDLPRFCLDIKHQKVTHRDLLSYIEMDPVHVLAVFDPSQSRVGRVTPQDGGFVHPLVLPKEFKYDSIEDKLVITPAATGDLFDVYYNLQSRLNDSLTGSSFGISASLTTGFPKTGEWLKCCTWLVLGDRSVDSMPSGGGQMISFEPGTRRDIVVLSESLTKFEREFDYHLRKANMDPSEGEIRELVCSSAELVGEGLLGLLRAGGGE